MVCELHAKNNCPLCVGPVQPNPVTGLTPGGLAPDPSAKETVHIADRSGGLTAVPPEPVPAPHTDPLAISITEAAAQYADAREEVADLDKKVQTLEMGLLATREGLKQAAMKEEAARRKMAELIKPIFFDMEKFMEGVE